MADQKTTILDLIRVHEDFVNPLFVCPCGGSFLILLSTAVRLADHASADIEMDFDLIDHDTAVFALNNVIYKMVRAPAQ